MIILSLFYQNGQNLLRHKKQTKSNSKIVFFLMFSVFEPHFWMHLIFKI